MNDYGRVQKLYTKRAALYERLFVDFLGWGRALETFFEKSNYVNSNFKVLDAGCGTGIITRTLHQLAHRKNHRAIQFHAFDITPGMLGVFQQWITKQRANNIEIKKADVLQVDGLPSDWKNYELIVSSTMLEYIPKDKIKFALMNMRQLLGSHGVLLIFVTKRNFMTLWLASAWWGANLYVEDEIRALLYDAGFGKIEFKTLSSGWSSSILVIEARNIPSL